MEPNRIGPWALGAILCALTLHTGCGGPDSAEGPTGAPAPSPASQPPRASLPALDALPAVRQSGSIQFTADLLSVLPVLTSAQGMSLEDHRLTLSPSAGGLAWAILAQPGYPADGSVLPETLRHNADAPGWLAFANFSAGRWDTLELLPPDISANPDGTTTVGLPGGRGLLSPEGAVYLAFIATEGPVGLDLAELTSRDPSPPAAPEGLSAGQWEFEDCIELRWQRSAMAEDYAVYRDSLDNLIAHAGDVAAYSDGGASGSAGHNYWVVALNQAGAGAPSNPARGYLRPADMDDHFGGWSGPGGDARNSRGANAAGPLAEAVRLAEFPTEGYLNLNGLVAAGPDGTVFVASQGELRAFEPDGTPRWSLEVGGMPGALALGAGGWLYAGVAAPSAFGNDDILIAVEQASGAVRWTYRAFAPVRSIHPGPSGLCLRFEEARILAFLSLTGGERWLLSDAAGFSLPAVGPDGSIYVLGAGEIPDQQYLCAYSPQRQRRWEVLVPEHRFVGDPVVALDGSVLVQVESLPDAAELFNAAVLCYSPQGELLWDFESELGYALGLTQGGDGHLRFFAADYGAGGGGGGGIPAGHAPSAAGVPRLYYLAADGAGLWFADVEGYAGQPCADASGRTYCLADTGIVAINASGQTSLLADIQGHPHFGAKLLVPAGPYRLLTTDAVGTYNEITHLIAIGQGP